MLFEQNQDVMLRDANNAMLDLCKVYTDLSIISRVILVHGYVPTDAEYDLLKSTRDMINKVEAKISYLNSNVVRNALKKSES